MTQDWQDWLDKLAADHIANQPQPRQVWVLRKDDAELVGLLRQALSIDLPERVEIESVDSSWSSDLKVKVKLPDGALMEIPVFEVLYEFYRPSVWDRLANEA